MKGISLKSTLILLMSLVLISCGNSEIKRLEKLASSGDAEAQFKLGELYSNSNKVEETRIAESYMRMAAEENHIGALEYLSEMNDDEASLKLSKFYLTGENVQKDTTKAITYLKHAAGFDNPDAQFLLGSYYYTGSYMPKDIKEATSWFEKAANQDHADAQFYLGIIYYEAGYHDNAIVWWSKAAEVGHQKATAMLSALISS